MNIDDIGLSPELREKARACKTPEEMLALAKEEGFELSDEQLQDVSGGSNWSCWPFCPEQCHLCGIHYNK